jgi:chromosome segregation ATPase
MAKDILNELDVALDELRAARERLGQLLPASANAPEADVRVSVAAWEQAQRALINAQEKVEMARREISRLLAED